MSLFDFPRPLLFSVDLAGNEQEDEYVSDPITNWEEMDTEITNLRNYCRENNLSACQSSSTGFRLGYESQGDEDPVLESLIDLSRFLEPVTLMIQPPSRVATEDYAPLNHPNVISGTHPGPIFRDTEDQEIVVLYGASTTRAARIKLWVQYWNLVLNIAHRDVNPEVEAQVDLSNLPTLPEDLPVEAQTFLGPLTAIALQVFPTADVLSEVGEFSAAFSARVRELPRPIPSRFGNTSQPEVARESFTIDGLLNRIAETVDGDQFQEFLLRMAVASVSRLSDENKEALMSALNDSSGEQ